MNVSSILEKKGNDCIRITENDSMLEASKVMCKHKIGSLVVFDDDKIKSIVTERDVMNAVGSDADLSSSKVAEFMPKNIVTCSSGHSLEQAMSMMMDNETGHRIRHLPVIDEGEFAGIISIVDVVEQLLTESQFENQILKNYIKKWPEEAAG